MSDLTPAIVSPPATSRDWFKDAKERLTEGVGKWNEAKALRNRQLGEFFYEAAIHCTKAQYAELESVAVAGFSVGRDQLIRFRTIYQRENQLDPPSPKSAAQQKRAIAASGGALERATEDESPQVPPPAGNSGPIVGVEEPATSPDEGRATDVGGVSATSDGAADSGTTPNRDPAPGITSTPPSTSRPAGGPPSPVGSPHQPAEPFDARIGQHDLKLPIYPQVGDTQTVVRWLTARSGSLNKITDRDLDALEQLVKDERRQRAAVASNGPRPFRGPIPKVGKR